MSLILLVVMTIVGVSSMQTAISEIRMAGIMQQEEVALRRAERTLLAAEAAIEGIVASATPFEFSTAADAFYTTGDNLNARVHDWSSISSAAGPEHTNNGVDDDDAYVVEYQGARVIPGETARIGTDLPIAGGSAYIFRNVTRSAEGKSAVRLVESYYTTVEAP